jgi:hypothetical protein
MLMKKLAAAAALTLALGAMPAFAQDSSVAGEGTKGSVSANLGIDISQAGTTDESRAAFWQGMSAADRDMVMKNCSDEGKKTSFTSDESAFCNAGTRH